MTSPRTDRNRKGPSETVRLLRGSALLVVSCAVVAVVALVPGNDVRLFALRTFAVLVLSFLPGWLFLRFVVVRAQSVWDEYVLNLHRLGVDRLEHLPKPPENSIYYRPWVAAGGTALTSRPTIYKQKFEAYYGKGVANGTEGSKRRLQCETFFPVILSTLLFSVGWVIVLWRPSTFSGHPKLPIDALCFAFMGAYLFTLQMLVRRYFQADLKASAYVGSTIRTVTALVVALTVERVLGPEHLPATHLAVAFVVGFMPLVGLQTLQKTTALALRTVVPSLRTEYPLSDLDGFNVWYEARLLELGVEDMQNLLTTNLVDVILHSRVPVGRLVDWVDQAILYIHLEVPSSRRDPKASRTKLRRLGIRSATSLQAAFRRSPDDADDSLFVALRRALNEPADTTGPSVAETLLKTVGSNPHLKHVTAWKADWRTYGLATPPPASAPPVTSNGNGNATLVPVTAITVTPPAS